MIVFITFIIATLAFCISAIAGGGAGLILVPLLRLILPMTEVPAALSIGTATGSLARIHTFRADVRWDVVRWFAPAALPMAALGAWALSRFEPAYVELLIGLFLLANLPALFRRSAVITATPRPVSRHVILLLGATAGLISGFTGAVGLLFNRAYQRMGMSKEELVATRAANEIAIHVLKIGLYGAFGLLGGSAIMIGAMIAVAAVLAAYVMRWALPRVTEGPFRMVSNLAMVAAGGAMFFMSSGQIMALHRAWTRHVDIGNEREFQLYWEGQRRFVVEWEADGMPVIERRIDADDLTLEEMATVRRIGRTTPIVMLERVYALQGRYLEIYVTGKDGPRKFEIYSSSR